MKQHNLILPLCDLLCLDRYAVFNVIWAEVGVSYLQFAVSLVDVMCNGPQVLLYHCDKVVRSTTAEVPFTVLAQGHLQNNHNNYMPSFRTLIYGHTIQEQRLVHSLKLLPFIV